MAIINSVIPILFVSASLICLRLSRSKLRSEKIQDLLTGAPSRKPEERSPHRFFSSFHLPDLAGLPGPVRFATTFGIGFAVFVFTTNPLLAILPWPVLKLGDRLLKGYRERKSRARKEEQMVEFIDSLIQSLRSGLSLQQSLELATGDLGDEMRSELVAILKELRMGSGLEETLTKAAVGTQTPALKLSFTVLGLLHGKGGDLPRILERLRKRAAEGIDVRREARILTSQSRASGYLVSALPVVFLLIQGALNPKSLQPLLSTPSGNLIILVALTLNATAFVFIRKIVNQEG
ncbi:MAG: hypothetical protein A2V52_07565 [Actinobacteria bacterium RBG_19FT_COMBO_54_7]|uniref:Type II secretion system protein GspF domain-containing protein n=1 Tax=Candidatus Solincola sediminis TaxID=1797199 RepID=A0A1F2WEZ9_9ACTN|nr:MAG: hypothetical protein A2Y75_09895 [Candidatus Solincola sediminis]OFW59120.1 MAG: hypothetical protein A2W01_06585 [Candidatus Solincola sediminis]OFW66282.1 MAG: hypothetical protein A2V52_07565 [Actinobacteria bacterium RBG_19FT_COMBO_54_7]